jgi:hypothetical protein
MFNIRDILFSSHYMFRSINITKGGIYELYMSLLNYSETSINRQGRDRDRDG